MSPSPLQLQAGECLEFWACRKNPHLAHTKPFQIQHDGEILFAVRSLAEHFVFFTYTNRSSHELTLEIDLESIDFSLFYSYFPASVAQQGVTFWEFSADKLERLAGAALTDWLARDPTRPALHFTPFKNWMNDPNGLCFIDGTYHLFYQFHPNSTEWGPMHWGHASSPNLYHWTHQPVFLHPEQNLAALGATGGAFSGSACVDAQGELCFYYTERLPAYDLFKGYREIQKQLRADTHVSKPEMQRTVLQQGPPGTGCDFRDPKVWWDATLQAYRMVLGSSLNGDPVVLLYASEDGQAWEFLRVLYRAPAHFREHGARCVECPDFFLLDGRWVLVMGFVGYHEPDSGRHNLLYAQVGAFTDDHFYPHQANLQEIDFGTDYYAMQSFAAQGRQLAMAWMFNWEFRKPAGSDFSGEMALPRVLSLTSEQVLCMNPDEALYQWQSPEKLAASASDTLFPGGRAFELQIKGALAGLRIEASDAQGHWFAVREQDGALYLATSSDPAGITYRSRPLKLVELRLFFDHGIIEIFANAGSVCGTRRSYDVLDPQRVSIKTDAPNAITQFVAYAFG